jgi:DNA-binding NtrC family response regulator
MSLGAFQYLRKPVQVQRLEEVLGQALGQAAGSGRPDK